MKSHTINNVKPQEIYYEFPGYPDEILTREDYVLIRESILDGFDHGKLAHSPSSSSQGVGVEGMWRVTTDKDYVTAADLPF